MTMAKNNTFQMLVNSGCHALSCSLQASKTNYENN